MTEKSPLHKGTLVRCEHRKIIQFIQKCYAPFCENHKKGLIDKCFQVCDNITGRTMKEVRKDGNFARRRCVAFMQCLSLRKVVKSKRVNAHEPPKGDLCAFCF